MSEYGKVPLGKDAQSMEISPKFDAYSGVEIIKSSENGEETVILSTGFSEEGRVLTISNPWGTQEQADAIYNRLRNVGFQYQPFTAVGAQANPAAEIGDGISVNGVYSGIYKMKRDYTSLALAEISAPQDEEVDHEFPYEPKETRIFKREIRDAQSKIEQNANQITLSVKRTDEDWKDTQTFITQTAEDIKAFVKKQDGSGSGAESFGWVLDSKSWKLLSGGKTVFEATKSGIVVSGEIVAEKGTIGKFKIGQTSGAIYSEGKSGFSSDEAGVYIGIDGIKLGDKFSVTKGGKLTATGAEISGKVNITEGSIAIKNSNGNTNFQVTSSGNLRAVNATLTGTLEVGGKKITADDLRSGAQSAASHGSAWTRGAGYGDKYNDATKKTGGTYPSFFKASVLSCNGFVCSGSSFTVNSLSASWKTTGFYDRDGNYVVIQYLGH